MGIWLNKTHLLFLSLNVGGRCPPGSALSLASQLWLPGFLATLPPAVSTVGEGSRDLSDRRQPPPQGPGLACWH